MLHSLRKYEITNKAVFMKFPLRMFLAIAFSLCAGLSGENGKLDVNTEVIEQNPGGIAFTTNTNGDVFWIRCYYSECHLYFWNREEGVKEIYVQEALRSNGYEPIDRGQGIKSYNLGNLSCDSYGNLFVRCVHQMPIEYPSPPTGSRELAKLGVWNKKNGFQMIHLPEIENVSEFQVSPKCLVVHGQDRKYKYKLVVVQPVDGLWPGQKPAQDEEPQESPEVEKIITTAPWDNLAIGKHGARLNLLCQLLCNTKDKAEKKTLVLMMEAEASYVFDVLEYERRRAQAAIDKAALEGKEDKLAREDYDRAWNQIAALKSMVKKLSKTSSRIFSLDFPSKNWGPR